MRSRQQFIDDVIDNEALKDALTNVSSDVDISDVMKSVRSIAESFADAFVKLAESIENDPEALRALSESLGTPSKLLKDGDSERESEDG